MMESSINSDEFFTPAFDEGSDLVMVTEEEKGDEGVPAKIDHAASMMTTPTTSREIKDDELGRSLPTDYASLFYHSMRRPMNKMRAKVPAVKAPAKEEAKHTPIEETLANTPLASPVSSEENVEQPTNPEVSDARLHTSSEKEESKHCAVEEHPTEEAPSAAPSVSKEDESKGEPSLKKSLMGDATPALPSLELPAVKAESLLPAKTGTYPLPWASSRRSDLLETPTTVPMSEVLIDNSVLDDVSMASQTIIPSASTSPQNSPMGESHLSFKVDDTTSVPEDLLKAMELGKEPSTPSDAHDSSTPPKYCQSGTASHKKPPRASSAPTQAKQDAALGSDSVETAPPRDPSKHTETRTSKKVATIELVPSPEKVENTNEDNQTAGLSTNAFVALGKALVEPFKNAAALKTKAQGLPMRRIAIMASTVVLTLVFLTGGVVLWKRYSIAAGVANLPEVDGRTTIIASSQGENSKGGTPEAGPEATVDEDTLNQDLGLQDANLPEDKSILTNNKDSSIEESSGEAVIDLDIGLQGANLPEGTSILANNKDSSVEESSNVEAAIDLDIGLQDTDLAADDSILNNEGNILNEDNLKEAVVHQHGQEQDTGTPADSPILNSNDESSTEDKMHEAGFIEESEELKTKEDKVILANGLGSPALSCEDCFDSASPTALPLRKAAQKGSYQQKEDKDNATQTQIPSVAKTRSEQECKSLFDFLGRYFPILAELQEFFRALPTFCQLLTAFVSILLLCLLLVSIAFLSGKPKQIPQNMQPEQAEAAADEPADNVPGLDELRPIVEQIDLANYNYLRKKDLVVHLRGRGLRVSGLKDDLIERLVEDYYKELMGLTCKDLKGKLAAAELQQNGKKIELVFRLLEAGF